MHASISVFYDDLPRVEYRDGVHYSVLEIFGPGKTTAELTVYYPMAAAERLKKAIEAFNAVMQEQEETAAHTPDRSPEERAAAEAGYMTVSEYVERNS